MATLNFTPNYTDDDDDDDVVPAAAAAAAGGTAHGGAAPVPSANTANSVDDDLDDYIGRSTPLLSATAPTPPVLGAAALGAPSTAAAAAAAGTSARATVLPAASGGSAGDTQHGGDEMEVAADEGAINGADEEAAAGTDEEDDEDAAAGADEEADEDAAAGADEEADAGADEEADEEATDDDDDEEEADDDDDDESDTIVAMGTVAPTRQPPAVPVSVAGACSKDERMRFYNLVYGALCGTTSTAAVDMCFMAAAVAGRLATAPARLAVPLRLLHNVGALLDAAAAASDDKTRRFIAAVRMSPNFVLVPTPKRPGAGGGEDDGGEDDGGEDDGGDDCDDGDDDDDDDDDIGGGGRVSGAHVLCRVELAAHVMNDVEINFARILQVLHALAHLPGSVAYACREALRRDNIDLDALVSAGPQERRRRLCGLLLARSDITLMLEGLVVGGAALVRDYFGVTTATTRGFDADLILVDEAAFISESLWREGIVPVLAQTKTSIIAVSTALDDDNFFSGLTQVRDEAGKLIFNVCRVGQICKRCAAGETPWLCTHKNYLMPTWKSSRKAKRVRAFYGEGFEHQYAREILGEIASGSKGAYAARLLDRFKALAPVTLSVPPRYIFFGIDPGGGGAGEMGITAVAEANGLSVIVALATISLRGQKSDVREKAALLSVLAQLRAKPLLRDAQLIVVCENVPFSLPSYICSYFADEANTTFMHEAAGGREGVPTTNESFALMRTQFEALLEQNRVRFASDLVCYDEAGPGVRPEERRTPAMEREKLLKQLANMRFEALSKSDSTDAPRFRLTGKNGGKGDDLAAALMFVCPHWANRFWTSRNPRYEPAKQRIRQRFAADTE